MENFIVCTGAVDHLKMSYLGLYRHFEIIADIVEVINSSHYYLYTESRSFGDDIYRNNAIFTRQFEKAFSVFLVFFCTYRNK